MSTALEEFDIARRAYLASLKYDIEPASALMAEVRYSERTPTDVFVASVPGVALSSRDLQRIQSLGISR